MIGENIFSYIAKAFFWIVLSHGSPQVFESLSLSINYSFSNTFILGFQIFCVLMALSNLVKTLSWIMEVIKR